MADIGICVRSYNRLQSLQTVIERIKTHTRSSYELIVCDDGSVDGTVEWLKDRGIRHITGRTMTAPWNLNRGLYYFQNYADCRYIMQMNDTIRVWEDGWEDEWLSAAEIWKGIFWSYFDHRRDQFVDPLSRGTGTIHDPYRVAYVGNAFFCVMKDEAKKIGYIDSAFRGGGQYVRDWGCRWARQFANIWGEPKEFFPSMNAHVGAEWDNNPPTPEEQIASDNLFYALQRDPIFRLPWSNEHEERQLKEEVETAINRSKP